MDQQASLQGMRQCRRHVRAVGGSRRASAGCHPPRAPLPQLHAARYGRPQLLLPMVAVPHATGFCVERKPAEVAARRQHQQSLAGATANCLDRPQLRARLQRQARCPERYCERLEHILRQRQPLGQRRERGHQVAPQQRFA